MIIDDIQTGIVYTGLIVASTRSLPAPAEEISYTVSINIETGSVSFEGVIPQKGARWSEYIPEGPDGEVPKLYPFKPGHRVPCHIERAGSTITLWIDRGEVPTFGGCDNAG